MARGCLSADVSAVLIEIPSAARITEVGWKSLSFYRTTRQRRRRFIRNFTRRLLRSASFGAAEAFRRIIIYRTQLVLSLETKCVRAT